MPLQYNQLEDTFYNVYESIETPKITTVNLPLGSYDISDFGYVDPATGTIQVDSNIDTKKEENPLVIINNNPEEPIETTNNSTTTNNSHTPKITKDDQKKTAIYLMNGLIKRGLKPHQAAGIVGNLWEESKFNSGMTVNDLGVTGGALASWRGERLNALKEYAKKQRKPWTNIDVQLDYLVSTISPDITKRLEKARDAHEASEAWAHYERYAGYDNKLSSARKYQKTQGWHDNKTMQWIKNNHKNRSNYAREVYKLWRENS